MITGQGMPCVTMADIAFGPIDINDLTLIDDFGGQPDVPLYKTDCPRRIYNALVDNNIHTVKGLAAMPRSAFLDLHTIGRSSEKAAVALLRKYLIKSTKRRAVCGNCAKVAADALSDDESIRARAYDLLIDALYLSKDYIRAWESNPERHVTRIAKAVMYDSRLRSLIKDMTGTLIQPWKYDINRADLMSKVFPDPWQPVAESVISEMVRNHEIINVHDSAVIAVPMLKDVVLNIPKEKHRLAADLSFKSDSYAEAAKAIGVTREYVRQLVGMFMRDHRGKMYEDLFADWYKKYDINFEFAKAVFEFDEYEYSYMGMAYDRGTLPEKSLINEALPIWIKYNFEKYVNSDMVVLNNRHVKKSKRGILDYAINACGHDDRMTPLAELVRFYENIFKEHPELAKYKYMDERLDVRVADRKEILWVQGRQYRVYNISDEDVQDLLDMIGIHDYKDKDIEISSLLLYNNNPEVMRRFDIRNHYELHNLLRKRAVFPWITYGKQPIISFGHPDPHRQAKDFMLRHEGLSMQDMEILYEKEYGISHANSIRFSGIMREILSERYSKSFGKNIDMTEAI